MTVGKSGELKMNCGGVPHLTVTAVWEERVDAAAKTSRIAVTGMTVTAEQVGRYTVGGTVSMGGSMLGRLTDCAAEVTEAGVPAAVMGGSFPIVSSALSHREWEKALVSLQLFGETPAGQRYYGWGSIETVLTSQSRVSGVEAGASFIGSPMVIAITPVESTAVHTLRYEFAGMRGVIGTDLLGGTHRVTLPVELCAAIPHAEAEVCNILCDTYIDGTFVGTEACVVLLSVPHDSCFGLSEGWVTLAPANEGTPARGLDCYVQGISRVGAVFDESQIDGSEAYGAYPVGFSLAVGGAAYDAPYVSEVLHSFGEIPVACCMRDSRGRSYEEMRSVQVLSYTPPALGDVAVFRCDAEGNANERGDCLSVSAGYGVCALGGRNRGALSVRLRSMGGDWGEAVGPDSAAPTVLWNGEISPNDSYEVLVTVTDILGKSASVTVMLPCTNVFFHGRKEGRGAAFGKQAEEDDVLEVAWSLKTKGNLVVEGNAAIGGKQLWEHLYPVGAVCSCGESADPAALFGGVWESAENVRHWIRRE